MSEATRHIGLDLGGTNIKWAVVQRTGDEWQTLQQGSEPTELAGGERSVVPQLAALAVRLRDEAERNDGAPSDAQATAKRLRPSSIRPAKTPRPAPVRAPKAVRQPTTPGGPPANGSSWRRWTPKTRVGTFRFRATEPTTSCTSGM